MLGLLRKAPLAESLLAGSLLTESLSAYGKFFSRDNSSEVPFAKVNLEGASFGTTCSKEHI